MDTRPTRTILVLETAALCGAAAVAFLTWSGGRWNPPLLIVLLLAAVIGDVTARDTPESRIKISSSFLAIITAAVLLGPALAAVIGVVTIVSGWLRFRYLPAHLPINLLTFAWFPLLAGLAFKGIVDATGMSDSDALFYLLVFGVFVLALVINFALIAAYVSRLEGRRFLTETRRVLVPLLPTELVSGLIAVGLCYLYEHVGLASLALFAIALLVLQYLIGALLLSQERADELEARARELAGFQVG